MTSRLRHLVIEHLRRRGEWYWAPALYVIAFVFVYRPIFFPGDGPQQGFGWDTIEGYWSDVAHLARQIGGDWPLWDPYDKGGYPDYAVADRGLFYPVNWGLAWYGHLAGEVSWWVIQVKDFLHHLLAACLLHLFLRSRGLPRTAALVGGAAWMCSAPWLIHKASSILWPMAWTPLVWLATDALLERPSWRRGCALGGALGLVGSAGSTPGFFYTLLLGFTYGGYRLGVRLWDGRRDPELRRLLARVAVGLACAAAVTIGLLLITYVPQTELTDLSVRAERSRAYVLMGPLDGMGALVGLVAPGNGLADAYSGILIVMLLGCALALAPLRDRGAPIFFTVAGAFFLALAFGEHTPLLGLMADHVPGFDLFRVANRYKLLAAPLLAAAAAHGAAALLAEVRERGWKRIGAPVIAAAVLALVVLLAATRGPGPGRPPDELHSVLLAGGGLALIIAAIAVPRRFAFVAVAAMAALVVFDPQHFVHHRNRALEPRMDNLEDLEWLDGLADVRRDWRIYDEFVLEQRPGPRLGIRELRGYPAGAALELERYDQLVKYARQHPHILAAFNVRYVFHRAHHRAGMTPHFLRKRPDQVAPGQFRQLRLPRCERMRNPADCPVFEAIHAVPAVVWYGAARLHPEGDHRAVLDDLRGQLDGGGVHVVALESPAADAGEVGPLTAAAAAPPPPVAGEVIELSANRMVVRVNAPGDGIVVVNDTMYPGWKVSVDGQPARPLVANWMARGVAVGAGDHVIEWRFRPRGIVALRWLWSLAFLAVVVAGVAPRRRRPPEAGG